MRFTSLSLIASALVCATLAGVHYIADGGILAALPRAASHVGALTHHALYHREVRVVGATLLDHDHVRNEFALERSNFWIRTHLREAEATLLSNSLIAHATVEPCSLISLGCFSVTIQERRPAAIVLSQQEEKAWVVGEDGGFITPLTREEYRNGRHKVFEQEGEPLIVVRGVWGEQAAPDEVRARIVRVLQALRFFAEELSFSIAYITYTQANIIEVRFRELPFVAAFELDSETLRERANRFRKIVADLEGDYGKISRIDLGFSAMGVVRLKDPKTGL
jgi:cell division septal protein FtsQ